MSEFGRIFNKARRAQGFRSQAHLDAFYRHFDHIESCPECQKPGAGVLLDDGFQPTMNHCEIAQALDKATQALAYAPPTDKSWEMGGVDPKILSDEFIDECGPLPTCQFCGLAVSVCECPHHKTQYSSRQADARTIRGKRSLNHY